MVKVNFLGMMVENILECIWKTRKMVMESSLGQMDEAIKVNGKMVFNMVKESITLKMARKKLAYGRVEND